VLALVLGLSGLKLIDVPGAGVAIVVLLAVGMACVLIYIGRRSWVRYQRRNGLVAMTETTVGSEPA
jgi:hypothetical protein